MKSTFSVSLLDEEVVDNDDAVVVIALDADVIAVVPLAFNVAFTGAFASAARFRYN